MRSMTGCGRGEGGDGAVRVRVGLTSVNRKQLDLRLVLPPELAALEPGLRLRAQAALGRGAVTATVACELPPELNPAPVTLDETVVRGLVHQWRALAMELGLTPTLTLGDLAAVPGVVREMPAADVPETVKAAALTAFDAAVADLHRMQAAEGLRLQADLERAAACLTRGVKLIREREDDALQYCRDHLRERIRVLGLDLNPDDDRLAKEIAFWAERSDIHEEVVRLESHLGQLKDLCAKKGGEPVGRALDFLCQEMGREINTLCAKAAETLVVHQALELRGELERLREQVQNVE